ncbi:hypothetical protein [Paenibacillus sp. NEAU-GSW1]|uniref:hypothetical protein n=1 Tax=Paenibacillus sp. NEAU-GSW1 TaxID=2682486 RepID=UPI0012E0D40B|nr:hypothetical protein [Paenibacillus sp. NEAU-GSW1]MUT68638.1 hypothetical protein [Paenibacillus sp. NEAU-GSW1]
MNEAAFAAAASSAGAAPFIGFVGTTPNIGTTAAAFALAYRIAEASCKPVGYLCLHLKSAKIHRYIGVDHPEVTLDKLRPELASCSLSGEKLLRAAYAVKELPNLQVLFGNMHRDQAEFFTPEEAEHLIDVARRSFSIVIADTGAYWDNAATVCAMRLAQSRIVVTTGALTHFQEDGKRWIQQISPLFGISAEQYETLLIHPPWGTGGYQMKEVCKELGTAKLGELRLSDTLFAQLDSGKYSQWLKEDSAGKKAMLEPAKSLMNKHGIRRSFPAVHAQPWYRKLISHRNGVGS